jgi:hypothetical protein
MIADERQSPIARDVIVALPTPLATLSTTFFWFAIASQPEL